LILLEIITETLQLSIATSLYPAIPANHERLEEEFILPKEGEIKIHVDEAGNEYECGDTKRVKFCKHEYGCNCPKELMPWDCGRYECPVCADRAFRRGAKNYQEHVWNTLIEMKKAYPRIKWKVSSVVISAPEKIWSMSYEKQHYYLRKAIKHLGTQDVAAIYHRWRYRDRITGELHSEIPWKEYIQHPDRYKRVLGVHWHCCVIGRIHTDGKDSFHAKTGWVAKKLKNKDTNSYTIRKRDVYNIAHYALQHTALSTTKRRHAIHYYGNFWRLTVTDKHYTTEPELCAKTGKPRYLKTLFHKWVMGVDIYGLEEPAVKMIVHRKYKLRGVDYQDPDDGLDFTGIDAPVKEVDYVDL